MDRDLIIFDVDGTLIDTDPIAHLWGDWDAFHAASFDCPERVGIVELARRLQLVGHTAIVTGKGERFRTKLANWLSVRGLIPDCLLMRPEGNWMSDTELKVTLLIEEYGPSWKDRVIAAIDDRDKMVDAWRAEGVTCLQAAPCLETKLRKERNGTR